MGRVILAAVILLAACRPEPKKPSDAPGGAAFFLSPAGTFRFELPPAWAGRYVALPADPSQDGAGIAEAVRFVYPPKDTTITPQVVLGVTVYADTAWRRASAEPGPPLGDVVLHADGRTYIASLPQSNPFPAGSDDAKAFDEMRVSVDGVKRALTLP